MIGGAELMHGDDTELSDVVFKSPEVVEALSEEALSKNPEMQALWADQMAYMKRAASGKNAKTGMRWHPR